MAAEAVGRPELSPASNAPRFPGSDVKDARLVVEARMLCGQLRSVRDRLVDLRDNRGHTAQVRPPGNGSDYVAAPPLLQSEARRRAGRNRRLNKSILKHIALECMYTLRFKICAHSGLRACVRPLLLAAAGDEHDRAQCVHVGRTFSKLARFCATFFQFNSTGRVRPKQCRRLTPPACMHATLLAGPRTHDARRTAYVLLLNRTWLTTARCWMRTTSTGARRTASSRGRWSE